MIGGGGYCRSSHPRGWRKGLSLPMHLADRSTPRHAIPPDVAFVAVLDLAEARDGLDSESSTWRFGLLKKPESCPPAIQWMAIKI